MSGNKTIPTQLSVTAFIDELTDDAKRADANVLVELLESVSGEKARVWGPSIIGVGSYHYVYESGREGDMPLASFSPRKSATVMYGMTASPEAGALLAKLGKHTVRGGCLYIKKLADVDQTVLAALVSKSIAARKTKHPN